MEADPNVPLPEAFLNFLKDNNLDPSIYSARDSVPRYIRIKPGGQFHVPEVEKEIKYKLEKVDWLPGFFAIPPHIQIAGLKAYKEGKIYGIDASSGAAVLSLDVCPGDHVLDLCAAPGSKLCMISDILGSSGSLTGVDITRHRLASCRTLLQKYSLGDRCRLFVADGATFSLLPLRDHPNSKIGMPVSDEKIDVFKEWTPRRSRKERRKAVKSSNDLHLVSVTAEPELIFYGEQSGVIGLSKGELFKAGCSGNTSNFGYDKVLVDAECTHDGSFKHIQKFEHWGWTTLQRRLLDAKRTDSLAQLQLKLLSNGFKLLRTGGVLVYSTCSLTVAQNEDVVERFLSSNPFAALQEIDAANKWPCKSGGIPKTLRFDPMVSRTSGLFIAKIIKLGT